MSLEEFPHGEPVSAEQLAAEAALDDAIENVLRVTGVLEEGDLVSSFVVVCATESAQNPHRLGYWTLHGPNGISPCHTTLGLLAIAQSRLSSRHHVWLANGGDEEDDED